MLRATLILSVFAVFAVGCGSDDPDGDSDGDGRPDQTTFGGDRPVEIEVSPSYDHTTPTPMLFVLHGRGATGALQVAYTRFRDLLDEDEVILVAPDGTLAPVNGTSFWNATDACCDSEATGVDDSAYLRGLVDEIAEVWNVDRERVYLFGHSNGGFMSYRLACDHADTFAALASLAGATYEDPAACSPSEPVSVLQIHGDADATVLYDGVAGAPGFPGIPSATQTVASWAGYNGCEATLELDSDRLDIDNQVFGVETRIERHTCGQGIGAELWTLEGGSHIPGISPLFHMLVWDWLVDHGK